MLKSDSAAVELNDTDGESEGRKGAFHCPSFHDCMCVSECVCDEEWD